MLPDEQKCARKGCSWTFRHCSEGFFFVLRQNCKRHQQFYMWMYIRTIFGSEHGSLNWSTPSFQTPQWCSDLVHVQTQPFHWFSGKLFLYFSGKCHMDPALKRKLLALRLSYPLVIWHSYWTSPFFVGKSTISMAIFNSKLLVYQRVCCFLPSTGSVTYVAPCGHAPSEVQTIEPTAIGNCWVSRNGGIPKWMIFFMENSIQMDENWGYPYFRKLPYFKMLKSLLTRFSRHSQGRCVLLNAFLLRCFFCCKLGEETSQLL